MKTMYVGMLIGPVLGSLELEILLPIFIELFSRNAITSWLDERKSEISISPRIHC